MAFPNSWLPAKDAVMKKSPLTPATYWRLSVVFLVPIELTVSALRHMSLPITTLGVTVGR